MVVVVVVLAVAVAVVLAFLLVIRSRLARQRALTAAAEDRAAIREAELAAKAAELEAATAEQRAAAALADERAQELRAAEERSTAAGEQARAAAAEASLAAERAEAAEQAASVLREVAASSSAGVDPAVLWILEQARSERTWRFSVAPHPDTESVFADAANPLLAALQVDVDAAREDVGAVVELDAELPDGVTVAASVLALRAAQELIADVARRSEEATVRVRVDGADLLVDIDAVDENGAAVLPRPLPLPPSPTVDVTETGVRIRGAMPA